MEQVSWSLGLTTNSGISVGDTGDIDIGASTTIPVKLDPETSVVLNLQLADTTKLDVFSLVSNLYDGSVKLTTNDVVFTVVGPMLICGSLINRISSDLTNLTIENESLTDQAELQIVIGRTLVS